MRARFPLFCVAALFCALPVAFHANGQSLASIAAVDSLPNGVQLSTSGGGTEQVVALRDDVIRVRASATASLPEDASWAVAEDRRKSSVPVEREDTPDAIGFRTSSIHISIARLDLRQRWPHPFC
jgi:alpha-glucosidase